MQTYHQNRPLEQGSAVSFVIVGLVLVGLLVGGIAVVKNRTDTVANTPAQTTQTTTKDESSAKDENTTKDSAPAATAPQTTTPSPTPTTPQTTSPTPSATPNNTIAATGPTETLVTTLILGFIAAMIARYFQSRSLAVRQ